MCSTAIHRKIRDASIAGDGKLHNWRIRLLHWITLAAVILCLQQACDRRELRSQFTVLSPSALLEQSHFVGLCRLAYVEELASLGRLKIMGNDYDWVLSEYVFRPASALKSRTNDSLVYLWYLTSFCRNTNVRNDLAANSEILSLVYGRELVAVDNILDLMETRQDRFEGGFRNAFQRQGSGETYIIPENIELAKRLLALDGLKERLALSAECGLVLYGTDVNYCTNWRFHKGSLRFRRGSSETATVLSSKEYLEELEKLARLPG